MILPTRSLLCGVLAAAGCHADLLGGELDAHVRVFDPSGAETSLDRMIDDLAGAEVVFLGETHVDDVTHRVELAVLEGLIERRDGRVTLAMEMFATDVQPVIDDYLAGRIDEAAFVRDARPWTNYVTGYRPLVESARVHGVPVVGSNIPATLRRRISGGGRTAFEELTDDERALVPPVLHPNSKPYWERVERATAGHMGMGGSSGLYSGQSLWDNTMGWSCAKALERRPDHLVLHVNGAFHTKYGQGTVEQLRLRRPGVSIRTVSVIPVSDLTQVDLRDAGRAADYLVRVERRARGRHEGFHAVSVSREVRYLVSVPDAATADDPAPLLIWLPEDGLRAADAEAYWTAALAGEAALAVVEPPYIVREDDLRLGGRWYHAETFHDDAAAAVQALERIAEYMIGRYPVDARRVVLAGAGTGATITTVAALESDRLPLYAVAVDPRRTGRLIERSVPDLPPATAGLDVIATQENRASWDRRVGPYASAGLAMRVDALAGDPYGVAEERVRTLLDLPAERRVRTLEAYAGAGSEIGRHWARVRQRRGESAVLDPDALADPAAIPVPAGPFGGTTVVVVPVDAPEAIVERLRDLETTEDRNPMAAAHGRFHRLVLAYENGLPGLAEVVGELRSRGRRNVLVLPAVFCADASYMRGLFESVRSYEERMTLSWRPGLGG